MYIKPIILSILVVMFTTLITQSTVSAQTTVFEKNKENIATLEESAGIGAQRDIEDTAIALVNVLLTLIGIIFTVLIVYGGIIYMTAAGNQENIDKGKKIITWAVIGLAIFVFFFMCITSFHVRG